MHLGNGLDMRLYHYIYNFDLFSQASKDQILQRPSWLVNIPTSEIPSRRSATKFNRRPDSAHELTHQSASRRAANKKASITKVKTAPLKGDIRIIVQSTSNFRSICMLWSPRLTLRSQKGGLTESAKNQSAVSQMWPVMWGTSSAYVLITTTLQVVTLDLWRPRTCPVAHREGPNFFDK